MQIHVEFILSLCHKNAQLEKMESNNTHLFVNDINVASDKL